jgi:hypothetical protein
MATYRLELAPDAVVARMLSAWTVTKNLTLAALTALWGALASLTSPLTAIVVAGVLLLATPLLLRRGTPSDAVSPEADPAGHGPVATIRSG